jgi:hypothetical protein
MTVIYSTPEETKTVVSSARNLLQQMPDAPAQQLVQILREELFEHIGHDGSPAFVNQIVQPLGRALEIIQENPQINDVLLARQLSQWTAEQAAASPMTDAQINALVSASFEYVVSTVIATRKREGDLGEEEMRMLENGITAALFEQLAKDAQQYYPTDKALLEKACEDAAELAGILVRKSPDQIKQLAENDGLPKRMPALFTLASAKIRVGRPTPTA